ncbi:MAG: T9SS type A sorting domain-containing protein [Bacteroidota bacterium]
MKKTITILAFIASAFSANQAMAQYDLSIGNIDAGFDSYNSSTGVITGIYFDALNNESDAVGSFEIGIYLIDASNSDQYLIHTINSNGQNGYTAVTYSGINIDINNTNGIPAGDYRLGVSIDDDEDISETDENNNGLYITPQGDNLSYTPGGSSAGVNDLGVNALTVFPNPAAENVTVSWENNPFNTVSELEIRDLNGRLVTALAVENNQTTANFTVSDLTPGIYVVALRSATTISTQKFVKQ